MSKIQILTHLEMTSPTLGIKNKRGSLIRAQSNKNEILLALDSPDELIDHFFRRDSFEQNYRSPVYSGRNEQLSNMWKSKDLPSNDDNDSVQTTSSSDEDLSSSAQPEHDGKKRRPSRRKFTLADLVHNKTRPSIRKKSVRSTGITVSDSDVDEYYVQRAIADINSSFPQNLRRQFQYYRACCIKVALVSEITVPLGILEDQTGDLIKFVDERGPRYLLHTMAGMSENILFFKTSLSLLIVIMQMLKSKSSIHSKLHQQQPEEESRYYRIDEDIIRTWAEEALNTIADASSVAVCIHILVSSRTPVIRELILTLISLFIEHSEEACYQMLEAPVIKGDTDLEANPDSTNHDDPQIASMENVKAAFTKRVTEVAMFRLKYNFKGKQFLQTSKRIAEKLDHTKERVKRGITCISFVFTVIDQHKNHYRIIQACAQVLLAMIERIKSAEIIESMAAAPTCHLLFEKIGKDSDQHQLNLITNNMSSVNSSLKSKLSKANELYGKASSSSYILNKQTRKNSFITKMNLANNVTNSVNDKINSIVDNFQDANVVKADDVEWAGFRFLLQFLRRFRRYVVDFQQISRYKKPQEDHQDHHEQQQQQQQYHNDVGHDGALNSMANTVNSDFQYLEEKYNTEYESIENLHFTPHDNEIEEKGDVEVKAEEKLDRETAENKEQKTYKYDMSQQERNRILIAHKTVLLAVCELIGFSAVVANYVVHLPGATEIVKKCSQVHIYDNDLREKICLCDEALEAALSRKVAKEAKKKKIMDIITRGTWAVASTYRIPAPIIRKNNVHADEEYIQEERRKSPVREGVYDMPEKPLRRGLKPGSGGDAIDISRDLFKQLPETPALPEPVSLSHLSRDIRPGSYRNQAESAVLEDEKFLKSVLDQPKLITREHPLLQSSMHSAREVYSKNLVWEMKPMRAKTAHVRRKSLSRNRRESLALTARQDSKQQLRKEVARPWTSGSSPNLTNPSTSITPARGLKMDGAGLLESTDVGHAFPTNRHQKSNKTRLALSNQKAYLAQSYEMLFP